jgi:hypothetical protein
MLLDVCTSVRNLSIFLVGQSGSQHPLILRLREMCLTSVFLKKRLVAATDPVGSTTAMFVAVYKIQDAVIC